MDDSGVPETMLRLEGEADKLKLGFRTVIVNAIELAINPLLPVTVTVYCPEGVPVGTGIVNVVVLLCA